MTEPAVSSRVAGDSRSVSVATAKVATVTIRGHSLRVRSSLGLHENFTAVIV